MDIKDYVKQFNYSFDNLKSKYEEDFNSIYKQEKEWLGNLEDKVHLLKTSKHQAELNAVIGKLKTDDVFTKDDTKILSTFVSKVNTIVKIANRINNFKEETKLDDGSKLELYKFFNSVKNSTDLNSFNYSLNSNLSNFLPHIFSVIKHCQNPNEYPIYYKYWKNIIREVLTKNDDYDSVCDFYRSFPELNRHLNFATYLGTIGIQIAKNINTSGISVTNDSKEYKYLTQDVINIERYNSILDEYLNSSHQYFVVGAYWDGSNPSDQTERFTKNGIWENGYDDKFTEEVKAVPEGSKIAIKAAFTREKTKSVMAIKAKGTVVKNYHDGKKLDINWEKEFTPFEVDFSGGYWATIKEVTKQDHIDQIFNHKAISDNVFLKTKMKFDVSIFENYIKFLRKINSELNLLPNDERVVYSVRDNRLNFTVGQRYSFNLYLNDPRGVYGVISKEKLLESSEPYDGTPPQPFYSYFNEFNPQQEEWNSIKKAINDELNRTSKSGYRRYNNSDFENFVFELEHNQNANERNMDFPLNTILYGPPGTGKTYNTINQALELCGEDLTGLSRSDIKARFEQKVDAGRIIFTTFHQSMTYEDFVEGIKPVEPEKEGDPVIYRVEEGIFRKLCIEASFSLAKEEESVATENVLDFSLAFDNFVQEIEEKLASEETIELATKNGGKVLVDGVSQQGNIIIKHPGKENTYPVSKQRLSKLHAAFADLANINNIDQQFRSIIGGSNSTANWSVLNAIRNNNPVTKQTPKEIRKHSWDDKVQVVKSLKKEDYKGKIGEPYVLIIDEINRGNVSQIFGELITLIEEDKRLGNPEAIQVQLPYSKDWFGVPPNVHIIGTMNTADRSVEALDTALRRRFSFTEMPPKPELINIEGKADNGNINGIELSVLLETINKRIEKLLDKDHMIGHSYFLSVEGLKGLKSAFKNKIVPLLQEYFFGDYGKIGLVIGSKFFDIKDNQVDEDFFAPFEDYDSSPLVERKVYHLKNIQDMTDELFIEALNDLHRINK